MSCNRCGPDLNKLLQTVIASKSIFVLEVVEVVPGVWVTKNHISKSSFVAEIPNHENETLDDGTETDYCNFIDFDQAQKFIELVEEKFRYGKIIFTLGKVDITEFQRIENFVISLPTVDILDKADKLHLINHVTNVREWTKSVPLLKVGSNSAETCLTWRCAKSESDPAVWGDYTEPCIPKAFDINLGFRIMLSLRYL